MSDLTLKFQDINDKWIDVKLTDVVGTSEEELSGFLTVKTKTTTYTFCRWKIIS